uniref:CSON007791 protein n=1 Tax=Culicoides sonorensis TaxID=179676 RepID=A0A336MV85_CULSO
MKAIKKIKMKFIEISIFFIVLLNLNLAQKIELPPGIQICYRNSPVPERNECIKQSMSKIIPLIKDGYKPLNITKFEPFSVEKSKIELKQGALTVKLNLKNILVKGISGVRLIEVRSKANDKNFYLEFDVVFPQLDLKADYKGSAHLNELNVKSGGKISIVGDDVTSTYKILGKLNKTNTDDVISIKGFDVTNIVPKAIKLDASGLFPDPDVNKFAVEFINQHWQLLIDQVVPEVKKIWGPVCVNIAKNFFEQVPYSQLLPKKET